MTHDTLRPSSLPMGRDCGASLATSIQAVEELRFAPDPDSTPAVVGSCFHRLMEREAKGEDVKLEDVDQVAADAGIPRSELRFLWGLVTEGQPGGHAKLWAERPVVLELRSGLKIAGTLDRAALYDDGELVVDDFKTGWLEVRQGRPVDEHDQMIAYGVALWDELAAAGEKLKSLTLRVIPVRLGGKKRAHTFYPEDVPKLRQRLEDLAEKMLAQLKLPLEERGYKVGGHCSWCRGRAICPAYLETMTSAVALVQPRLIPEDELPKTKGGKPSKKALKELQEKELHARVWAAVEKDPARLWDFGKLLSKAGDLVKDVFKERTGFFGPIDLGDYVIERRSYQTRGVIGLEDVRAALRFEEIPEDQVARIMDAIENRPTRAYDRLDRYRKKESGGDSD